LQWIDKETNSPQKLSFNDRQLFRFLGKILAKQELMIKLSELIIMIPNEIVQTMQRLKRKSIQEEYPNDTSLIEVEIVPEQ